MRSKNQNKIVIWIGLFLALAGCGTMAGNPVQPTPDDDGDGDTTNLIAFKIPEIDFEVPEELQSESADLMLANNVIESGDGDRALIHGFSRRLDRVLRDMKRFNNQVNNIIAKLEREGKEPTQDGDLITLRFGGRGDGANRSGKIIQNTEDKTFSAVICIDDVPVKTFGWSDEGKKLTMVRSFGRKMHEAESGFDQVSRLTIDKTGDDTVLDLETSGFGAKPARSGSDGDGHAEHITTTRKEGDILEFKSVSDWFEEFPEDGVFEGDTYLVGRSVPAGANSAKTHKSEYLAYSKAYPALCSRGFDEDSDTLFAPEYESERFCVGRPLIGKAFDSWEALLETAESLEPIGINKAADLSVVEFPEDASCE